MKPSSSYRYWYKIYDRLIGRSVSQYQHYQKEETKSDTRKLFKSLNQALWYNGNRWFELWSEVIHKIFELSSVNCPEESFDWS